MTAAAATAASAIDGAFFDGGNSRRIAATLRADADGRVRITGADGAALAGPLPLAQLEVSSRLGNMPRFLRFAGNVFETPDNDAVDALLAATRPRHNLAHRLESKLRYALAGVAVTALCVWGGVRYGIPALAETAAFAVSPELSQQIGDGALALLDRGMFEPSGLDGAEQARLRARFAPFVASARGHRIQVEFRDAEDSIGPNALALPSGGIVFTDQLVRLAQNDEELLAILAHEIGHIERRHALRHTIQSSVLGVLAMALTGDVSSVASVVTVLPVILTEMGYSRDFEREADRHAAQMLVRNGIGVEHFAAILTRLDGAIRCGEDAKACGADAPEPPRWHSYASTHPPTAERLRALAEPG